MNYREPGKTGYKVSEVSFGAWAIGAAWGNVKDDESIAALHTAVDSGVNFFDTADVYGDGHSENAGNSRPVTAVIANSNLLTLREEEEGEEAPSLYGT